MGQPAHPAMLSVKIIQCIHEDVVFRIGCFCPYLTTIYRRKKFSTVRRLRKIKGGGPPGIPVDEKDLLSVYREAL
jgi:hypothetical protein